MSATTKHPAPVKGVMDIHAYVPGKSAAPKGVTLHKLSANETPLGPSENAKSAYLEVAGRLQDYPDGSSTALREAIGEVHGLNPANIMCGAGSDELLSLICQTYLSEGDEGIYTEHGFLVYRIGILAAGAAAICAKETKYKANVDSILQCVTGKTKIVFLANPNNPTGTYLPIDEVRRLHSGLPSNVILVLDAAYSEYVRRNDYEAGTELVSENQNVIMTRTFSKIHGLAALRIGWMFAPATIIDAINRIRGPFNVGAPAIAAAAAAVRDRANVDKSVAYNDQWLSWTIAEIKQLGLEVTPSVGNFFLMHFPDEDGKRAADADAYLTSLGFILRQVVPYGLPNALRMSLGTPEANRGVVTALKKFLDV